MLHPAVDSKLTSTVSHSCHDCTQMESGARMAAPVSASTKCMCVMMHTDISSIACMMLHNLPTQISPFDTVALKFTFSGNYFLISSPKLSFETHSLILQKSLFLPFITLLSCPDSQFPSISVHRITSTHNPGFTLSTNCYFNKTTEEHSK